MKSILAAGLICAMVVGCGWSPGWGWKRTDGQSTRNNPVLAKQFETDRTACIGEMQKAGLSGATSQGGGTVVSLQSMHRNEAMEVIRECMSQKGYRVVQMAETE